MWFFFVSFRKFFFFLRIVKRNSVRRFYHLNKTKKRRRRKEIELKERAIKRPCYGQSTYCSTFSQVEAQCGVAGQWCQEQLAAFGSTPLAGWLANVNRNYSAKHLLLKHQQLIANWISQSTSLAYLPPFLIDEVKIHRKRSRSRTPVALCAWAICFQSPSPAHDLTLKNEFHFKDGTRREGIKNVDTYSSVRLRNLFWQEEKKCAPPDFRKRILLFRWMGLECREVE